MKNIMLVKVGDASTGSVPKPEDLADIEARVKAAIEAAGRDDVPLVLPYYTDVSIIEAPGFQYSWQLAQVSGAAPAMQQPIDLTPQITCDAGQ